MPSLDASNSTASNDVQPVASASRNPDMKPGRAAGIIRRRNRTVSGKRNTCAASRNVGWASRTPINVCRVTGTTMALISTTSLSTSPMPKNTMNRGIHANVGICASALKVGSTTRSARRLNPITAPSTAPMLTPASNPTNRRCKLMAKCAHSSPEPSSSALCHTSEGGGRICSLIH